MFRRSIFGADGPILVILFYLFIFSPFACPVQGAEVNFAVISQDFGASQKWAWRLPLIETGVWGGVPPLPRVVWRESRDVFSDTYIWSVLLAWESRAGGAADGSGRSYKLLVAENWKGQSCKAVRRETLLFYQTEKVVVFECCFCRFGCTASDEIPGS